MRNTVRVTESRAQEFYGVKFESEKQGVPTIRFRYRNNDPPLSVPSLLLFFFLVTRETPTQ